MKKLGSLLVMLSLSLFTLGCAGETTPGPAPSPESSGSTMEEGDAPGADAGAEGDEAAAEDPADPAAE